MGVREIGGGGWRVRMVERGEWVSQLGSERVRKLKRQSSCASQRGRQTCTQIDKHTHTHRCTESAWWCKSVCQRQSYTYFPTDLLYIHLIIIFILIHFLTGLRSGIKYVQIGQGGFQVRQVHGTPHARNSHGSTMPRDYW